MEKVLIVGCGAYMDSGYGCPGEWRCLKAASCGDGDFDEPVNVAAFVKCECPGRSAAPNVGLAVKAADAGISEVRLSTCFVKGMPACPYATPEEFAEIIAAKTGLPVELGTHQYH